jgi:hypothetical protein
MFQTPSTDRDRRRCYSAAVNFDFSADQKALRDQARKFLAEHASSVRVRRILDTDEPYDRDSLSSASFPANTAPRP